MARTSTLSKGVGGDRVEAHNDTQYRSDEKKGEESNTSGCERVAGLEAGKSRKIMKKKKASRKECGRKHHIRLKKNEGVSDCFP